MNPCRPGAAHRFDPLDGANCSVSGLCFGGLVYRAVYLLGTANTFIVLRPGRDNRRYYAFYAAKRAGPQDAGPGVAKDTSPRQGPL